MFDQVVQLLHNSLHTAHAWFHEVAFYVKHTAKYRQLHLNDHNL